MTFDAANTEPDRMALANYDSGEIFEVQFNPTELHERLDVVYARLGVVGMSHELLQYGNTKSLTVDFTLNFDAVTQYRGGAYDVAKARRFLHSVAYSRRTGKGVAGGAPPRVVLMWPGIYTLTCKLISLDGTLNWFGSDLSLKRYTARLALEEIRDMRIWSEDVAEQGTERPAVLELG